MLGIISAWCESISHVDDERKMRERLTKWKKFLREHLRGRITE